MQLLYLYTFVYSMYACMYVYVLLVCSMCLIYYLNIFIIRLVNVYCILEMIRVRSFTEHQFFFSITSDVTVTQQNIAKFQPKQLFDPLWTRADHRSNIYIHTLIHTYIFIYSNSVHSQIFTACTYSYCMYIHVYTYIQYRTYIHTHT